LRQSWEVIEDRGLGLGVGRWARVEGGTTLGVGAFPLVVGAIRALAGGSRLGFGDKFADFWLEFEGRKGKPRERLGGTVKLRSRGGLIA
jgi:hypothetical protein